MLNSLTTVCVSYFAATLTRYVRVSVSVAFHEGSFQMNCLLSGLILFMAHKSLVDWQQLKLFFSYFKTKSSSHFKRMRKLVGNSHLQSRTSQLGSDTCCESHRNVRVLNLFACPCLVRVVQICSSEGKDPIVVVKREEGSKNKATRRTNQ